MSFVRALFGVAAFVLIGATLAGLVLPRVVQVERSVVIAAPAERIFPYINSQRMFIAWSPWTKRDSAALYNVEGGETGMGSMLRWHSEKRDIVSGEQQIVESRPNEAVRHRLTFEGLGEAQSLYALKPAPNGTVVSGRFAADLGPNPYMRLLGILVERRISADLDRGLWLLRGEVEDRQKSAERAPAAQTANVGQLSAATQVAVQ